MQFRNKFTGPFVRIIEWINYPILGQTYHYTLLKVIQKVNYDPNHTILFKLQLFLILVLSFLKLELTCLFSLTDILDLSIVYMQIGNQLKKQHTKIVDHSDSSMKDLFKRYIVSVASFYRMCFRALTIFQVFCLGICITYLFSSGTGIHLIVIFIYGYYKTYKKEEEQGTLKLFQ